MTRINRVRLSLTLSLMVNIKIFLLLLISIPLTFGVVSYTVADDKNHNGIEKLKWIESASPENDARTAMGRNDFRLRAVYGYTIVIPGVNNEDYDKIKKLYGINPIEGTSDTSDSPEHAHLNSLAIEYALKYNRLIMSEKK